MKTELRGVRKQFAPRCQTCSWAMKPPAPSVTFTQFTFWRSTCEMPKRMTNGDRDGFGQIAVSGSVDLQGHPHVARPICLFGEQCPHCVSTLFRAFLCLRRDRGGGV